MTVVVFLAPNAIDTKEMINSKVIKGCHPKGKALP
jgi:hypothetical protein